MSSKQEEQTIASPPSEPEPKHYFESPANQPVNDLTHAAVPTVGAAIKTITMEDFKKVHLQPCFRDANLWAIPIGFVVGGGAWVVRGNIARACNWAVGAFVGASIIKYEHCMYRRKTEKAAMRRAAEIMEMKRVDREKKLHERKEKAAAMAAEKRATSKSWLKFW